MDIDAFEGSLKADAPPPGLGLALEALWFSGKGDWKTAHERAQEQDDRAGAWVHAHLHREEGDLANAAYWYRRADQPVCERSLKEEWQAIARALLDER